MRFGDLTYHEIAREASRGALAVVPLGCTEQQGPHLPVGFDTWFADTLMITASEVAEDRFGIRSLVLPTLPFGSTHEHISYGAGYIDLPQALHEGVVAAVLRSLSAQGFKRIVVWPGCGGHDVGQAVGAFNVGSNRATVVVADPPFEETWRREGLPDVEGGHADSFTTSLMLHRRPNDVRREEVPPTPSKQPDRTGSELDFKRYSESGVIGDARHASAELGERLWSACVDRAADFLWEAAHQPIDSSNREPV